MEPMNWGRTSRHARGYDTQWDKIRLEVLKRDCYLSQCPKCKEEDSSNALSSCSSLSPS